ncbi:peptide chain release factor N(5)-glutamine methyltransferase [Allohahella marinimesophila]
MPDSAESAGLDSADSSCEERTVKQLLLMAGQALKARGADADEARLESELLLLEMTGKSRAWLRAFDDTRLSLEVQHRFEQLLQRRLSGEPLAYILGRKDFWSLELYVTDAVLIPREDTEVLVTQALQLGRQLEIETGQTVLDVLELGTGSGAIICALATEETLWQFTATDVSAEALAVATTNVTGHGFAGQTTLLLGSWFDALENGMAASHESAAPRFDLIISNPPYIAEGDPHLDAPALRHEPALALSSGTDGLDSIRHIVAAASRWLQPTGWLLLEHGYDQGPAVRKLMRQAGYENVATALDLAGQPRVTMARHSVAAVQIAGAAK